MTQPWQRVLIQSHLSECQSYLEEARLAGDLDLCAELAAKMREVLAIWRRFQGQTEPTTCTLRDGVTRSITAMAAAHAIAEEFPSIYGDDWDEEDA